MLRQFQLHALTQLFHFRTNKPQVLQVISHKQVQEWQIAMELAGNWKQRRSILKYHKQSCYLPITILFVSEKTPPNGVVKAALEAPLFSNYSCMLEK